MAFLLFKSEISPFHPEVIRQSAASGCQRPVLADYFYIFSHLPAYKIRNPVLSFVPGGNIFVGCMI